MAQAVRSARRLRRKHWRPARVSLPGEELFYSDAWPARRSRAGRCWAPTIPTLWLPPVPLAIDLRDLGHVQAARDLNQDTLDRRRVLGPDHPDTLDSAHNLAIDLRLLGDAQAARDLNQDILDRRRRILGEDHPDTLRSANDLAADLRELGEIPAARDLDQDTLDRCRRVLGADHPDTLASASGLAVGGRPYTVLSTVGMSCQGMPVIEQLLDDPGGYVRIELAVATTLPSAQAARVFSWLAPYPWHDVTWFGLGHSVCWDDEASAFPLGVGEAVVLLGSPGVLAGPEPPDLSGFTFAGDPVRWLWVVPILERERQIAMDEGSGSLVSWLAEEGRSWIAGPGDRAR